MKNKSQKSIPQCKKMLHYVMFGYQVHKLMKIGETEMPNSDTRTDHKAFADLPNGCKYFAKFQWIFNQLYGTIHVNLSQSWKKFKTSNICHYSTILSSYVWENTWLLYKSYWDELDVIDQGHSKRIV